MVLVLVRAPQRNNVGVSCKVVHDLHLALHICNVLGCDKLALRDGFAGKRLARLLVCYEARGAKLALAQSPAEVVAAEGCRNSTC
jgi:hypothetical protein